jgi:hypothetical protein
MSWFNNGDSACEDGTRNSNNKPGLHNSSWWNPGYASKSGLHNSSWWNASYDTPSHQQQHTSWFRSEQLYGEPNDFFKALQQFKEWIAQQKVEDEQRLREIENASWNYQRLKRLCNRRKLNSWNSTSVLRS